MRRRTADWMSKRSPGGVGAGLADRGDQTHGKFPDGMSGLALAGDVLFAYFMRNRHFPPRIGSFETANKKNQEKTPLS